MSESRLGDFQFPKLALVAREVVMENRLLGLPLHGFE